MSPDRGSQPAQTCSESKTSKADHLGGFSIILREGVLIQDGAIVVNQVFVAWNLNLQLTTADIQLPQVNITLICSAA